MVEPDPETASTPPPRPTRREAPSSSPSPSSSRRVKIAICQFHSTPASQPNNLQKNLQRMEKFIGEAADAGAQLVVFPEYAVTSVLENHTHLALEEGVVVGGVREMARRWEIDVVAGTLVEKDSENEEDLYNSAYYIDKHGEILGKYVKRNLWHPEKEYLKRGEDEHTVFETAHFKAGFLICWDLAWPEAFRALFHQGVEVVIVPTFWTKHDIGPIGSKYDPTGANEGSFLDSLCIARAYENECCIVFVNCGGPESKGYLGRSAVTMPLQGAVARATGCEEELVVVEVDLNVLKAARQVYKIHEDIKTVTG